MKLELYHWRSVFLRWLWRTTRSRLIWRAYDDAFFAELHELRRAIRGTHENNA